MTTGFDVALLTLDELDEDELLLLDVFVFVFALLLFDVCVCADWTIGRCTGGLDGVAVGFGFGGSAAALPTLTAARTTPAMIPMIRLDILFAPV